MEFLLNLAVSVAMAVIFTVIVHLLGKVED